MTENSLEKIEQVLLLQVRMHFMNVWFCYFYDCALLQTYNSNIQYAYAKKKYIKMVVFYPEFCFIIIFVD